MAEAKENLLKRLRSKWEIKSNVDLIAILIVFAINGSFAAWVADPITNFIGLEKATTNGFIYWPIRLILIFPVYQLTLPIVGWCFGQFKFFWNFEKKMFARMTEKALREKESEE